MFMEVIVLINSDIRKFALCGWLKTNNKSVYNNPKKLHIFLFLYECFSKVENDNPDFNSLEWNINGPVFSNVWIDYTKNRNEFDEKSVRAYEEHSESICSDRVETSNFIVSILTENELLALIQAMNIWSCKNNEISSDTQQTMLYEKDFNDTDFHIISTLKSMYPVEMIRNTKIVELNGYYFIMTKSDFAKLNSELMDELSTVSHNPNMHNPIYIELFKDKLVID